MAGIGTFTKKQRDALLKKGVTMLLHNYFSGLNLVSSEHLLPTESILIHFLHDSQRHLDGIVGELTMPYLVVPRRTFYVIDQKYVRKSDFADEYKNATFFDNAFQVVSIDELAYRRYEKLIVENEELDLIIPASAASLPEMVSRIQQLDKAGESRWFDPVIIIKTEQAIPLIPGFDGEAVYLSIAKEREELYTIVRGDARIRAVKAYLTEACTMRKARETSVTCHAAWYNSQINKEFASYMAKMLDPLEMLE